MVPILHPASPNLGPHCPPLCINGFKLYPPHGFLREATFLKTSLIFLLSILIYSTVLLLSKFRNIRDFTMKIHKGYIDFLWFVVYSIDIAIKVYSFDYYVTVYVWWISRILLRYLDITFKAILTNSRLSSCSYVFISRSIAHFVSSNDVYIQ